VPVGVLFAVTFTLKVTVVPKGALRFDDVSVVDEGTGPLFPPPPPPHPITKPPYSNRHALLHAHWIFRLESLACAKTIQSNRIEPKSKEKVADPRVIPEILRGKVTDGVEARSAVRAGIVGGVKLTIPVSGVVPVISKFEGVGVHR
jgi:hypothetical protein